MCCQRHSLSNGGIELLQAGVKLLKVLGGKGDEQISVRGHRSDGRSEGNNIRTELEDKQSRSFRYGCP